MAETEQAVLVNISDMIDLAIGTPEVGVVDFNMLQTVLHCLAQQLRVLGKNVELRGSVANLPVNRENTQTIAIAEYVVDTEGSDGKSKRIETKGAAPTPPPEEPPTMLVVERVKKNESPLSVIQSPTRAISPSPAVGPAGASQPGAGQAATGHAATGQAAAGHAAGASSAPMKIPSAERLSLVTISKFNVLQNTVDDLKNRVYSSIPKNEEILQEVRSQTDLKAIQNMWTSLNVSSRLEAAEAGINKLSSLVQDLIGETTQLQDAMKRRASQAAPPAMVPSSAAPASAAASAAGVAPGSAAAGTAPGSAPGSAAAGAAPGSAAAGTAPAAGTAGAAAASAAPSAQGQYASPEVTKQDMAGVQAILDRLRGDLDNLTNTFYTTIEDIQNGIISQPPPLPQPPPTVQLQVEGSSAPPPPPTGPVIRPMPPQSITQMSSGVMEKLSELEKKMNRCCDSIAKNEGVVKDQLHNFQDQIEYLHKQMAALNEELSSGKLSPDLLKDLQGLMALFQTVQEMQQQLKQVHETALQLAAEKEERQGNLNALLEQIELLKTIKMDREDMEEAMAEKADMRLLARKVSHDQFELACDDLSRGLEHALGKLNLQEALWQQALDDIQREIETKLDKMELSPVRDFFNNKLKQLQENLKQMASLRREAEAAGTKKRLLRDVNCISCDARAVMPMENTGGGATSKPLPATFSMKPYLSYELDAIRKAQASNVPQRNMHDWENIDKQMAKPPPKAKSESDKPDKHICNRYCGGSHTTTTPAQRVARLGHFIKQWGPDVLPLSSGLAAGDDGKMYRVTTTEAANVGPGGAVDQTCTPKQQRKSETPRPPQKPMVISAECRCLEGDRPK